MIVHQPTIRKADGDICCGARLEMQRPLQHLPQELWYCFPEKYASHLSPRADAFTPTALLVAMYAGEDLIVRGPISPRLAYSLYEFRDIFHSWQPEIFQTVDIQYECLEPATADGGLAAVATSFSGGVDSFYTLWAHMPDHQPIPQSRVTHGLFVHGLDSRLDDESNFQVAAKRYQALFENLGLELILASTNAYQFSEFRINWTLFFGPPTVGAALLLSPFLGRFYMPAGMPSYLKLVPQSSHPLIDHLLSTETLEVVHHGVSISRYEKVKAITNWPVTYQSLRVCSDKLHMRGLQNCSACHKCYRTMTLLEILDVSQHYSENFPKRLTIASYLRWGLLTHLYPDQARAIRRKAIQYGHYGMAFWIQVAIVLRLVKKSTVELFKKALGRERVYRLKRRVYRPESDLIGKA
jgi:hypothetical protein